MLGVIVVAAGSGIRLAAGLPKAFAPVAGVPMLQRALGPVGLLSGLVQLVLVTPADRVDEARRIAKSAIPEIDEPGGRISLVVVPGAPTRQGSVAAGLAALAPGVDIVLVHDAARALTPAAQFERVVDAVRATHAGVIPALPVSDTIKRVAPDGTVLATIDRSDLVAVQTPQGFPRHELVAVYASAASEHTDDAALYAAAGHPVVVVAGEAAAHKITTADDLARAEAGLRAAESTGAVDVADRTGIGVDVHAFGGDAVLRLGGVDWPGEQGLDGHSDGDAVLHAIADALLSAGGLGDLGGNFGVDDERFRNADSSVFVTESVRMLREIGFAPINVAVQIIAKRPKIGPRREELEAHLSQLVGARVSVSATTSDGLGVTGRGEGIAAIATALIAAV